MPTSKGEFHYLDENGERQDASLHEEILSGGDDRAAHKAIRPFLKNVLKLTDGQINASYGVSTKKGLTKLEDRVLTLQDKVDTVQKSYNSKIRKK